MATNKERVVFYVEEKVKQKLTDFAQIENRSLSNWLENLALREIQSREKLSKNQVDKEETNFNDPIAA